MSKRMNIRNLKPGSIFYVAGIEFGVKFKVDKYLLVGFSEEYVSIRKTGSRWPREVAYRAFEAENIFGVYKKLPKALKVLCGPF